MTAQELQSATITVSVDANCEPALPLLSPSNIIRDSEKQSGDAAGVDSEKNASGRAVEASVSPATTRKPLSFHLAFLFLLIMVFMVSLDTTTLAVALHIIARELGGTTLEAFGPTYLS